MENKCLFLPSNIQLKLVYNQQSGVSLVLFVTLITLDDSLADALCYNYGCVCLCVVCVWCMCVVYVCGICVCGVCEWCVVYVCCTCVYVCGVCA